MSKMRLEEGEHKGEGGGVPCSENDLASEIVAVTLVIQSSLKKRMARKRHLCKLQWSV